MKLSGDSTTGEPMKVGVMGGSFNPIHIGHLVAANEVAHKMALDRVYFVLSARPPHKDEQELFNQESRYRMMELALAGNPVFRPSRVEMDRPGPSYTIDTMRHYKDKYGESVYFILGQDAMEDIGHWHSAPTLLKTLNFIVVARPGYDASALMEVLQGVLSAMYKNIRIIHAGHEDGDDVYSVEGSSTTIRVISITQLDISSSSIRRRIAAREPIKYLVPGVVERYLIEEEVLPSERGLAEAGEGEENGNGD